MVLAVAHSSTRLVAASRSAAVKHLRAASTSGTITGTSSAKGGSNGRDSRPSPTTATTNTSGHRGGKGVRIFFETQAMAHKRRQQRLSQQQQQQQRGKRTDNKGRADREQPQLLKTFRPSSSGDTGGENLKGSGDSKAGLSVPYRPFVFPGDAYRYPFYTSRRTTGDDNSNAAPLPLLDSSPLLDPARYCKKSALPGGTTTVSGGDAARRLGRGRTRLGQIVRNQLVSVDYGSGGSGGGNKTTRARKAIRRAGGRGTREHDNEDKGQNRGRGEGPFALDGTGIPRALMQGSLDLADELLRSMDGAAEISFGNCYDGSLDFNVLRVRSRMGDNDPQSWPLVQENWMPSGEYRGKSYMESWEHRMQLYLTVMNRLSRAFGGMIDPAIESADSKFISADLPDQDSGDQDGFVDDQNNDTDAEAVTAFNNNKLDFDLRSWNASFMRGLAFPPNMIPDCQLGPLLGRSAGFESRAGYVSPPIVELNQSVGSVACPTHVRITIQGTPSASAAGSRIISSNRAVIRRKRVSPITLVFDGKFSRGDVSS